MRGWHRAVAVALAVASPVLGYGCGYSLAGRGSFLPAYIRTIGVPMFTNKTQLFQVEQTLTERVRQEFIARGRYEIAASESGADAILFGEISSLTVTPASFNDQQQATRYIIAITAKLEFRDLKTDKVLWENPAMVFRDEYDVSSGLSASDAASFFGQESNALERVAGEFARSVVSSILEAF